MNRKKYTTLYLTESIYPIVFLIAMIVLEFVFYFRLLADESQAASTPLELLPIVLFLGGIVFVVLYMLFRFVEFSDEEITYRDLKNKYSLRWEDVQYVKITLNGNNRIGRGSYIVIANSPYTLQHTDFRSSRDGFMVLKYRPSVLSIVKKHYNGEIIHAVP